MTKTQLLQEVRKMRFMEAYDGWSVGRLTQEQFAACFGFSAATLRHWERGDRSPHGSA